MHARHQLLKIRERVDWQNDKRTEFQLSCPHRFWRVDNKTLREVALNTADHIMVWRLSALTDDSKGVVLHNRGSTNSTQETLLHAPIETKNGNFRRRLNHTSIDIRETPQITYNFNFNWDLSKGNPGNKNTV